MRSWMTIWMFGILLCCVQSCINAATTVQTHINTSNHTHNVKVPSWRVHDSCSRVHDIPANRKCAFVRNVTACQPDGGLINYFIFTHCWMPNSLVPLSAVIMVSLYWVAYVIIWYYLVHLAVVLIHISWSNCWRLVSDCTCNVNCENLWMYITAFAQH